MPKHKMLLLVLLPGVVTCNSLKETLLQQGAAPTLRRVVVLARHGSKVPDPRITGACPAFAPTQEKFLTEQQSTPNELTPKGFNELYEAGQFARHRYIDSLQVLPPSFYLNNTFSFSSQRSAFCLQSTTAFAKGMFPDGTGPAGFLPSRPQIVPVNVPYGKPGEDVLFNCRDGPCAKAWLAGKAKYSTGAALDKIKEDNKELLTEISQACGGTTDYASMPTVIDQLKYLDDDLTWAQESGLSGNLDGSMSESTRTRLSKTAFKIVVDLYVGYGEQLAVTACGFPSKLLSLLGQAESSGQVQFDFFLNHREMLYGTLEAFFIEKFELPGHFPGFVTTGSSIFFELHEDNEGKFVKIYLYVSERGGQVLQLIPKSCHAERCPLSTMERNFQEFVAKNGDINKICVPSGSALAEVAPATVSIGGAVAFLACVAAVLLGLVVLRRSETLWAKTVGVAQPLMQDQ